MCFIYFRNGAGKITMLSSSSVKCILTRCGSFERSYLLLIFFHNIGYFFRSRFFSDAYHSYGPRQTVLQAQQQQPYNHKLEVWLTLTLGFFNTALHPTMKALRRYIHILIFLLFTFHCNIELKA